MLKQLLNECIIELNIRPDGPILIKSGLPSISGPDMAFVTTWRNGRQEVYLPGSSLKGVIRSHAERIIRTLKPPAACNPFVDPKDEVAFCGKVFDRRKKDNKNDVHLDHTEEIYADSCLACRLFGSTWFAGRLATEDAYAIGDPPRPQQRDGVGIDRFTGGAAQGVKFDMEVVSEGVFATRLHLRNFELWQLGLLGFILADLKDGLVRIGAAKSRGLGRVIGEVTQVRVDFLGASPPSQAENGELVFKGLGSLVADDPIATSYDLTRPDEVTIQAPPRVTAGVRTKYLFSGEVFPWQSFSEPWLKKVDHYHTPERMRLYRGGR